jgi:hypothetical protein
VRRHHRSNTDHIFVVWKDLCRQSSTTKARCACRLQVETHSDHQVLSERESLEKQQQQQKRIHFLKVRKKVNTVQECGVRNIRVEAKRIEVSNQLLRTSQVGYVIRTSHPPIGLRSKTFCPPHEVTLARILTNLDRRKWIQSASNHAQVQVFKRPILTFVILSYYWGIWDLWSMLSFLLGRLRMLPPFRRYRVASFPTGTSRCFSAALDLVARDYHRCLLFLVARTHAMITRDGSFDALRPSILALVLLSHFSLLKHHHHGCQCRR